MLRDPNRCTVCGAQYNIGPGITPGSIASHSCPNLAEQWHKEASTDLAKQSTTLYLSHPQPAPLPNRSRPIWELVIEDMKARDHFGRQKYGTPLQAGNGRDAMMDAYQEALDLCVYFRQLIEERKA